MRKINCICYIEDPEYKKVLSTFLLSSGIFNITEEGASGTESVNSSSELSIRFMDNLLNPVNDSENAPGEKTGDNTKPNANHPSPCILLSEKRGERFRDNVLEIYKYTPFGEIIKKTNALG